MLRMCVFFCTFAAEINYSMALTRTYYRVAEHLFAVESSYSELLQCMTNYEPFAVEELLGERRKAKGESREGEEIFTLRVEKAIDERLKARGEGWTHVMTDTADEDMPRIEVYRSSLEDGAVRLQDASLQFRGGGWLFRVAIVADAPICCELECNEGFTEGVLHIMADCQDVRFCVDNALMLLFAFRTAPLKTLEMHAAVVVRPSLEDARGTSYRTPSGLQDATLQAKGERREVKGYLFLGHSGTGKSTHARMWLQAFPDAWLLNDDNPILRVMDDGEVRVYGSPWSGKTPCYNNAYARVGGIVKLSQAPHNKIRSTLLPEAYAYMLSSASGLKMDRKMSDCMHDTIKHIVMNVKCYQLDCLPNIAAAEHCYQGMSAEPK